MASADRLLELMFSWIEQRERCAEQLQTLARELESLREKCNAGECVGSGVAVVGAACLLGAAAATVLTAGAAAPFLGVLGAAYSGVGVAVSLASKITEHFVSSSTLKEARTIEQNSSNIAEEIQKGFERLKAERREASSFADPDDLDRHVMTEVLRALARRSGLDWGITLHMRGEEPQFFFNEGTRCTGPLLVFGSAAITGYLGILAFFTFKGSGKKYSFWITKGTEQLVTLLSSTAFKTGLKRGAIVVGGAVGMAFALHEAIDNWTELIKKNHVTEASQSLRDTADAILKMTRVLRGQFDDMKKMFDDIAKREKEREEKETTQDWDERDVEDEGSEEEEEERDREEEESEEEEEESDREEEESEEEEEESDREEEESEEEEEEESDRESEEEESEEEESDREEEENEEEEEENEEEEEESDREEEESDREEEESDREEEESEEEEEETEYDEIKQTKRYRKKTRSNQREESNEALDPCPGPDRRGPDQRCPDQRRPDRRGPDQTSNGSSQLTPPATIRMALLNLRSMNNKTSSVLDLITQNNLDVLLSTETFLREYTADNVLRDASPPNFSFYYQTRGGRGGGTAIQFTQRLWAQQVHFNWVPSFELVAAAVQHRDWDHPVLVLNVYRRPRPNLNQFREFLNDFQTLLDEVSLSYTSIMLTGDFNIWVDVERRTATDEFDWLLLVNDLDQHVDRPTHRRGHTLDLVITRNVEVFDISVSDNGISDHYTVFFNARPVRRKEEDEQEEASRKEEE